MDASGFPLVEVIEETRRSGEPVYVTRRGQRVAVIVDPEAYERMIDTAEEAADRRELQIARDEDDYVPWEEVKPRSVWGDAVWRSPGEQGRRWVPYPGENSREFGAAIDLLAAKPRPPRCVALAGEAHRGT